MHMHTHTVRWCSHTHCEVGWLRSTWLGVPAASCCPATMAPLHVGQPRPGAHHPYPPSVGSFSHTHIPHFFQLLLLFLPCISLCTARQFIISLIHYYTITSSLCLLYALLISQDLLSCENSKKERYFKVFLNS